MRADAQRSYERILAAAEDVFTEFGTDASLNEVAKRARVGPGTLYRHFPDRDALLDALMGDWVGRIELSAEKAARSELAPRDMLLDWFEILIAQISRHRGGAARIVTALSETHGLRADKAASIVAATSRVLVQLAENGTPVSTLEPRQLARLVAGVGAVADLGELDRSTTRQLLSVIADGLLRPGP